MFLERRGKACVHQLVLFCQRKTKTHEEFYISKCKQKCSLSATLAFPDQYNLEHRDRSGSRATWRMFQIITSITLNKSVLNSVYIYDMAFNFTGNPASLCHFHLFSFSNSWLLLPIYIYSAHLKKWS